jgi:hypothetical protein
MVTQSQNHSQVADSPISSGVKNDDLKTAFSYLGIYTEFSSPDILKAKKSILRKRYILQSTVRNLLPNNKRISACNRVITAGFNFVSVKYNSERKSARYGNLCRCESGWICPVCAVALSERRRFELLQAVAAAKTLGMTPIHIIYTMKHSRGQALRELLHILIQAYDAANSGRAGVKMRAKLGFFKPVRGLEVTEGSKGFDNGWHPHLHVLMFVSEAIVELEESPEEYAEKVRTEIWPRWERALEKFGGSALEDFGLKVRTGDTYTAEYIAKYGREPREKKWSIEREIAKSNVKVAREDGRTPFALLEDAQKGDVEAAILFIEFAEAIKGRSQLHWAKGLKEMLQIEVLNDREAIAWGAGYISRLLIDRETWSEISKKELRGDVVASIVESDGDPFAAIRKISELTEAGGIQPIYGDEEIIF